MAGASGEGDSGATEAPVSELRFRRLLRIDSREELYHPMIRVVSLLDQATNVERLAHDVFFWGTDIRKRWAQDYFEHVKPD
jgi:CRISPR system Cascade subunit CasB